MRLGGKSIFLLHVVAPFFVVLLFLTVLVSAAAGNRQKIIRGELFTEPAEITPMPEDWIRRPVKYQTEHKGVDMVIVMDQDIYFTLLPLINKFGRDNNLKLIVKEGTCGIAAGMLAAKTADVGGFCCPAGKEDRLPGLRFHTMGIVAKAFFVHPENPVDSITTDEIRGIYQRKIYRWSELKTLKGRQGPASDIRTVGRLHCKKRPGHWRRLLDDEKQFSPRLSEVGSIPDMIAQVAASKTSIGWEVLTMVEKYKDMGKVKTVRIDGYSPRDSKALASLKYPFYRVYNLTTWEGKGVENHNAKKLINYMIREFEKLDQDSFGFVSASRLKKSGWKFRNDELVGEPD